MTITTVHVTKKLLAKLPLDDNGKLVGGMQTGQGNKPNTDSPLGDWHANLITLQNQHCVLFVHDTTRFPVFIKELREPDFADLSWRFEDGFMNTLLKVDADDKRMKAAADCLRPLQFDNICNRSVQGTMTRMIGDFEFVLQNRGTLIEDLSAYQAGAWLADRPCTVKGLKDHIWPIKSMFALIDDIAARNKTSNHEKHSEKKFSSADTDNVISLDEFRK